MTITLVNTHATDDTIVELKFDDAEKKSMNSWRLLASEDIHAHNTFENPENVKPRVVQGTASLMKAFVLPPASVSLITYSVRK
jgi:alpha-N-arabinofuranosidase